jgi:prepilin-type N-terminal cleavage/methylation domain-containing protein
MGQGMTFVILTLIYPVKRCDWLCLTMKRKQNKIGVTLVEMLVVVAVIAILVTMVIGVASRINTQGKKQLTENTIAILTTALGQFRDYGYTYSDSNYADFKFPLDCNGFSDTDLKTELETALGVIVLVPSPGIGHDPNYSGCEVLYFFLNRVPDCRGALDKIDKSLVTSKGSNDQDMIITVDSKDYPLFRVIDPWGETLRYSYYDNTKEGSTSEPPSNSPRTFPLITSAGPDKKFGSTDDITSRD